MSHLAFLIHGQSAPPPKPQTLAAGLLHADYDSTSGFLRNIRFGETELLQGIYAAVRDQDWGTVPGRITEFSRQIEPDFFRIEFSSLHQRDEIQFEWAGIIEGRGDGTLRYLLDGIAKSRFRKNRIGFCVLHPLSCAGACARQARHDGTVIESRFPRLIEPQIFGQATFRDLRELAREFEDGSWMDISFEGDRFEMEDQRNWTDASFKTYCTPLALPFPVEIPAGTRIRQSVTIRLRGNRPPESRNSTEVVAPRSAALHVALPDAPSASLPLLGLGMTSDAEPLTPPEIARLRELHLDHLRLDLRLAQPEWPRLLRNAAAEAAQVSARLELALHLPLAHGLLLPHLADELLPLKEHLVRVLVLPEGEPATGPEIFAQVREALGTLGLPIGAGSDCNFCELNREQALGRLALHEADFLFWAINPQVHACDHLSIMETLRAQGDTVRTARSFAGARPLLVSPITLKQRFNPVATGAGSPPPPPGQLPPQIDPRQLSLFAAAWTLGSLTALAQAGAASITFFETTGPRGIMERETGSPFPNLFPSKAGMLFPVYHLLKLGAAIRTSPAVGIVSIPGKLAGLVEYQNGQIAGALLANLTNENLEVHIESPKMNWHLQLLDAGTIEASLFESNLPSIHAPPNQPLDLGPCAVALLQPLPENSPKQRK